MAESTVIAATQFFDLVLKYQSWHKIRHFQDEEMQVLLAVVKAAGFNAKEIKAGKITGHQWEDGVCTATFIVNDLCPFKVISQEDRDHGKATEWLNDALKRVILETQRHKDRREIIALITDEIEKSVPLTPIQLTPEGDILLEYPRNVVFGGFLRHSRDNDRLDSCVGIHGHCHGWMDRHNVSFTHDSISCRACYLRVTFPRETKTYGELRQALAAKLAK